MEKYGHKVQVELEKMKNGTEKEIKDKIRSIDW